MSNVYLAFHNERVLHRIDANMDAITKLINEKNEIWYQDVLFTWRWWTGLAITIFPWILWAIFRKKESTDRLLYVGFIVMLLSVLLDAVGDQFGIWHYRYNLVPIVPTYFPWDFTLMPVVIMSLIQFKPRLNYWIKAILFSLGSSYVGEPLFHWIDVYQTIHWHFTYSVPIQFLIYLLCHKLYHKRFRIEL